MAANTVPEWAMHVRSSDLQLDWTSQDVAREVEDEMARKPRVVRQDHLPPEQMGLVAVSEIEKGHFVDASLWLAIASYRYHEETLQAVQWGTAGASRLGPDVNPKAYYDLVEAEIRRYAGLGFESELEALRARIYGEDEKEEALQQQLLSLGKTSAMDRASLRDALVQLRPESRRDREASRYPKLVDAFRRRLRDDAQRDREDEHPAYYLARTPIPALQAEALLAIVSHFEPAVCAGVAAGFPAQRDAVAKLLTATRSQQRANAAATFALAPTEETRKALESQLAIETNDYVKLALAYALIHHGATEHVVTLTTALQTCRAEKCTLPVMLADWLPIETQQTLDQGVLARILADPKVERRGHRFATITLRTIGRSKPLEPAAIEALIVAARRKQEVEYWGRAALEALHDAVSLSRAQVIARIDRRGKATTAQQQDVLSPGPLLARLGAVALEEDLPLLGRLMDRFGDGEGPEAELIVEAVIRIPGEQADARLINWFNRYKHLRTILAVGLLNRPSVGRDRVLRLVERSDGRTQMVVKLATQDPNAPTIVRRYMQFGEIQDKLAAAELAGVTAQESAKPELRKLLQYRDARYYPNDVLVRHAAMSALVRIAFVASRPPAAASAPAPASAPGPAPAPVPAPVPAN